MNLERSQKSNLNFILSLRNVKSVKGEGEVQGGEREIQLNKLL